MTEDLSILRKWARELSDLAHRTLSARLALLAWTQRLSEKLRCARSAAMGSHGRVALRPLHEFLDGKGRALPKKVRKGV